MHKQYTIRGSMLSFIVLSAITMNTSSSFLHYWTNCYTNAFPLDTGVLILLYVLCIYNWECYPWTSRAGLEKCLDTHQHKIDFTLTFTKIDLQQYYILTWTLVSSNWGLCRWTPKVCTWKMADIRLLFHALDKCPNYQGVLILKFLFWGTGINTFTISVSR